MSPWERRRGRPGPPLALQEKPPIASHRSISPPTQQLASPLILSPRTGRPPGGSPAARRTDSARDFGPSTRSSQPSMPHLRARARLWNRSRPGRPPCPPKPRCCRKINTPCSTARRRDTARAFTVRPYPPRDEPRAWLRMGYRPPCRTRGHGTEQKSELGLTSMPTELPKWTRVSQRLNPAGY